MISASIESFSKPRRRTAAAVLACLFAAAVPARAQPSATTDFFSFISQRFSASAAAADPANNPLPLDCAFRSDPLAARVLAEYGAMYAASNLVTVPAKCIYPNSQEVAAYQRTIKTSISEFSGSRVELQASAAAALDAAKAEAFGAGIRLSPFDAPVAGRRDYGDSVRIWNKRLLPALDHWEGAGIIGVDESFAMRNMPFVAQARKVLEWESRGYKFGTGRLKSIFVSCSPPGASQHLSLLAFDVLQYNDRRLQLILNKNGWYQTVIDDPGHFTFLGLPETELPARGLKLVPAGGYAYWVPDIRNATDVPSITDAVTRPSD
ncbi:MAG: hypothetical protein ABI791_04745 [Acidobacteriota bacterium]